MYGNVSEGQNQKYGSGPVTAGRRCLWLAHRGETAFYSSHCSLSVFLSLFLQPKPTSQPLTRPGLKAGIVRANNAQRSHHFSWEDSKKQGGSGRKADHAMIWRVWFISDLVLRVPPISQALKKMKERIWASCASETQPGCCSAERETCHSIGGKINMVSV